MHNDLTQRVRGISHPKNSEPLPDTSPARLSTLDKRARVGEDRDGFLAQQVRSETGIGASGASSH